MKILVEVEDSKAKIFLEAIKEFSYVERAEIAEPNSILNPHLLESIESYETGKVQPTAVTFTQLKEMINA